MYGTQGGSATVMQSGGGGGMVSNAITPISPMQEARNQLVMNISTLHDRIADLERRLSGVCLPAPPSQPQDKTGSVGSGASELRGFLADHAAGVYAAVSRLESVMGRLEL